jgi:hypothetical protein
VTDSPISHLRYNKCMPDIQFEQEQYGVAFQHPEAVQPWFIRLIFKLGLTNNNAAANAISVVAGIFILAFAIMFYVKSNKEPQVPSSLLNIGSYRQDIYTNFYE